MSTVLLGRLTRGARRAIGLLLLDPRDAALSARMAAWIVVVSGLARLISLRRAMVLHVRA